MFNMLRRITMLRAFQTVCSPIQPLKNIPVLIDVVDTHETNVSASDTDTETHTYTIDWQYDTLTWSVDGNALRTLKRSDTWNATGNRYDYPQTPSRIQLSLWPAGLASNGQGTIEWSGGLVNWNSPYMKNGYYYAMISDVNVQCYDPPSGASTPGSKSYVYTNVAATNQSISITDDETILASLYATGNNPKYNPYGTSQPSSQPSNAPETVPGVVGIGTRGDLPGGSNNAASGNNNTNSGGGFSQGTNKNAANDRLRSGGSVFAVLVAVVCVCFWL
jgi:glycosyl hydrolase family 16